MRKLLALLLALAPSLALGQSSYMADRVAKATLSSTTCPGSGCVEISTAGGGTVGVHLVSGAWVGDLTFEATTDGTNWSTTPAFDVGSPGVVSTVTGPGQWRIASGGSVKVRVRVSAFSSGSMGATLRLGDDPSFLTTYTTIFGNPSVSQSGTWTVQPGNTTNTAPWLFSINEGGTTADVFDLTSSNPLAVRLVDSNGDQVTSLSVVATDLDVRNLSSGQDSVAATIAEGGVNADVLDLTNNNPLACAIVDGAGTQITSFGGGTQYTEGDTDASISGTAMLWEDTSDTLRAVSAVKPLPVNIISGAGSGGTAAADDSAFTLGTTNVTVVGCIEATDSMDAGDLGGVKCGADRELDVDVMNTVTVSGTVTVTDGAGALNVIVDSSALPSGASTLAEQQTQTTSLQKIDNLAHSGSDVALSEHAPVSGQYDDAATTTVTENNVAPVRITSGRALHVAQQGTATVSGTVTANAGSGTFTVGDGAGALNVIVDSGTLTANQGGAPWSVAGPAADGTAVSGNPVRVAGKDGSGNTQDIATDTSGELQVDVLTLPSVTIGTFPDNEPVNVAQMNGVAITMGNGASGTGVQRVTIASDSTGQVAVASLPNEGQQTAANSISVTPDTDNDAIAPDGGSPGELVEIGGRGSGATAGLVRNIPIGDTWAPVDIVTATTTLVITGVSGRHVYITSINLMSAGANNVAIVSGTGATCATSTAGMAGGTTAAEGWNFAANGGLTHGSGVGAVMRTETTGDSVCIITSAANQLSGTIGHTIF